jgi:hypothetical protein
MNEHARETVGREARASTLAQRAPRTFATMTGDDGAIYCMVPKEFVGDYEVASNQGEEQSMM